MEQYQFVNAIGLLESETPHEEEVLYSSQALNMECLGVCWLILEAERARGPMFIMEKEREAEYQITISSIP